MSVTQWVYNTYSSDEKGLQESRNFVFVWSLFENQIKNFTGNLRTSSFDKWVQTLEIKQEQNGISIKEPSTENYIENELIGYINKAFNHFYQKYTNDNKQFLNHLYNQTDDQTQDAKTRFQDFLTSFDKKNIRDKIIFLFHISKRIRNKFFHGIKNIDEITSEQKEFEKINGYLIAILSLIEQY
ncbi:hypothetical protein ACFWGC_23715 [Cytobacillus pseudoceanisediminis]|uniref:hypothetical protein n=1 Tax=Cytobacillus pseudoceanisediminis TaxID=3051614 RepID=UPI00365BC5C0